MYFSKVVALSKLLTWEKHTAILTLSEKVSQL